ncbi:hypothetical protein [Streptomyces sp. L2]|uniref:hypothetical protein n=1 Tax=Streptomyces sp. L2 TaxID=2162665 RepID=UPI001010B58A|nr:hypothetical protein [Streptomyces sp. L2]
MIARLAAAALALVSALAVPVSASAHTTADAGPRASAPSMSVDEQLAEAYAATSQYRYLPLATADGYEAHLCLARPQGGMGFHYFNPSHYGSLDPKKPGGLLYEQGADGKRRLVGVEWVVPVTGKDQKRPSLFGHDFAGPMPGHYPGMPRHYDLHVWLYKKNPNGMFDQWNPDVKCPASTSSSMS